MIKTKKRIKMLSVLIAIITAIMLFTSCTMTNFELKFEVDGEIYDTLNTDGKEIIKLPTNPEKEGYKFGGWYWDKGKWEKPFTANSLLDAPLSSDMTVYAKWDKIDDTDEVFSITFDADGGSPVGKIEKEKNKTIDTAPVSTKENYTFDGWYDGETKVIFPYIVTANKTLTAKWTIKQDITEYTFNTNGGSMVNAIINVIETSPVITREGYAFMGWFDNAEFSGLPVTFPYSNKDKTILYANWQENHLHIHQYTSSIIAAKCLEDGYTLSLCICGNSYKDNIITALGHTGGTATCAEKAICERCSLGYGETLDHNYTEGNCIVCEAEQTQGLSFISTIGGYSVNGIGSSQESNIIIPSKHNGLPVTSIGERAFNGSNLTNIIIPNSVTSIGGYAFFGCSRLISITIPKSITSIGYWAFTNCSGLTIYAEAKSKPKQWNSSWNEGRPVIWDCENNDKDNDEYSYIAIDKITYRLKDGIATAYAAPSNLITANIESAITYKGTTFTVTSIGSKTFYGCSLTNITIPNSVKSIDEYAFEKCNLESIIIPGSVSKIDKRAFAHCTNLESITFEDGSDLDIGYEAFAYCSNIVSITFEDGYRSINIDSNVFVNCISLLKIIIPARVERIGSFAFSGCSSLTINAEAASLPSGWANNWNSGNRPIVWGFKVKFNVSFNADGGTTVSNIVKEDGGQIVSAPITSKDFYTFDGWFDGEIKVSFPYTVTANKTLTAKWHLGELLSLEELWKLNGNDVLKIVTSFSNGMFNSYYEKLTIESYSNIDEAKKEYLNSLFGADVKYINSILYVADENNVISFVPMAIETNKYYTVENDFGFFSYKNIICTDRFDFDSVIEVFIGNYKKIDGNYYTLDETKLLNVPNKNITEFIIPNSVTHISVGAFLNCGNLVEITIPANVTSIGSYAFSDCDSLTINAEAASLPSGWANNWNSGNRPIVWGFKVKFNVSFNADGGTTVSNIVKEDGGQIVSAPITSKDFYTFDGWFDGEIKVSFPYTVTANKTLTAKWTVHNHNYLITEETIAPTCSMDGFTIYLCECGEVEKRDIVYSLGHIGGTATCTEKAICERCKLEYGETVEHTFESVFTINLEPTCTENGIKSKHCTNCDEKEEITVIDALGHNFNEGNCIVCESEQTAGLVFREIDGGYEFSELGTVTDEIIFIPAKHNGQPVTSIGSSAFYFCSSLKSITIPSSVLSIGSSAFYGCRKLTSITIPSSVRSIGGNAFDGCSSLVSITIPSSVTSIGNYAFYDCSSLESITVESGNSKYESKGNCLIEKASKTLIQGCNNSIIPTDGCVTNIGDYAFYKCSSLTSLTIPNSVTSIGGYAFYVCSSLTSITIPSNVTSIGSSAFSFCSSLKSITIPSSVLSIDDYAFGGCSGLESITVESGNNNYESKGNCLIEKASKKLIQGCNNSIIPTDGSVTNIGGYAFANCNSITSITIPNSVTSIGERVFFYCTNLESITFAEESQLTSIGSSAFNGCYSLKSITIPSSVTSIGSEAFYRCYSLKSITIPFSVTSIGSDLFSFCDSLTINAEAASLPSGWASNWNSGNRPIVWGYKK